MKRTSSVAGCDEEGGPGSSKRQKDDDYEDSKSFGLFALLPEDVIISILTQKVEAYDDDDAVDGIDPDDLDSEDDPWRIEVQENVLPWMELYPESFGKLVHPYLFCGLDLAMLSACCKGFSKLINLKRRVEGVFEYYNDYSKWRIDNDGRRCPRNCPPPLWEMLIRIVDASH